MEFGEIMCKSDDVRLLEKMRVDIAVMFSQKNTDRVTTKCRHLQSTVRS